MFKDMTPVGIWRDSLQFWCRAATYQMEMTLHVWGAMRAPAGTGRDKPVRLSRPRSRMDTPAKPEPARPRQSLH